MERVDADMRFLPFILLALLIPAVLTGTRGGELDPGPYLIYLRDVMNNMLNENYHEAIIQSLNAMNFSLPGRIGLTNRLLYTYLYDASILMERITSGKYVEEDAYELYRLRFKLDRLLEGYIYSMSDLVPDKATGYVLRKELLFTKDLLVERIEYIVSWAFNKIGGRAIGSKLIVPAEVTPGGRVDVRLVINVDRPSIDHLNATLSITAGFYRERTTYNAENLSSINGTVTIILHISIPGTEKTLSLPRTITYSAVIEVDIGGRALRGFVVNRSIYRFEKPLIFFDIPAIVRPGGNLSVRIYSKAIYPLNSTVYVDTVDDKHLIYKFMLLPGLHRYTIPFDKVNRGIHTVYIHVDPRGRYIGTGYSKAVAVTGIPVKANIILPDMVLAPPYEMVLSASTNTPGVLRVYIGNSPVYNGSLKSSKSMEVEMPWTPTVAGYDVRVILEPSNRSYDPFIAHYTVYVMNLPLTTMIAGLVSFMLLITSDEYRVLMIKLFFESLLPPSGELSSPPTFLGRLGLLLGSAIRPWETLREYYRRMSGRLGSSARETLWRLITTYEEYRYSDHRVDPSVIPRLLKDLWRLVRPHRSP